MITVCYFLPSFFFCHFQIFILTYSAIVGQMNAICLGYLLFYSLFFVICNIMFSIVRRVFRLFPDRTNIPKRGSMIYTIYTASDDDRKQQQQKNVAFIFVLFRSQLSAPVCMRHDRFVLSVVIFWILQRRIDQRRGRTQTPPYTRMRDTKQIREN